MFVAELKAIGIGRSRQGSSSSDSKGDLHSLPTVMLANPHLLLVMKKNDRMPLRISRK
jgi:hypothetical protein